MIDTIKLAYPLDSELDRLLETKSELLQKISPDGEVLWQKYMMNNVDMPSHYPGLRVTFRRRQDLKDAGYKVNPSLPNVAFFEFSLQKYQSQSAYNNRNTTLQTDLIALAAWINVLSAVLGYPFDPDQFELCRVDLSMNFLVLNASPVDMIRSLELSFSRHPDSDGKMSRYGHAISLRSRWLGKKLYYKFKEFLDIERKKWKIYSDKYCDGDAVNYTDKIVPLSAYEINDLSRMLRFECEFKLPYLKRHEDRRIQDIELLCVRFESEKAKYTTVPVLIDGDPRFSAREEHIINLVRRLGLREAKHSFIQRNSERSWYRVKRELAAKSLYLEALDNIEQRTKGLEILHDQTKLDFQLIPAPYADQEPYSLQVGLFGVANV